MTSTQIQSTQLAIHGGAAAITSAPQKATRWGELERVQLEEMLAQPSLFYWNGPQTKLLVERFQSYYPLDNAMACSSGTAAIHIAVAAAGIGPGDEVITTPITDMGTVIGVLFQQGVPVFADLDSHTYNLDPQSVRENISEKTKAIIAVHLAGNPCAMKELRAIADEFGLVLIEDCAQAWGAFYRGEPVGTIGHIGCWSLNDFKHITCGDGGIVASNDQRFASLLQKFGDKAYDRSSGARLPDALAPNYRISEPQSAVAAAQMARLKDIASKRADAGKYLNALLQGVAGICPPQIHPDNTWACWFYMWRIDEKTLTCDAETFAAALTAEGVTSRAGYIGQPLYRYPVFANENFFSGRWPVKELGLTTMDYTKVCCPQAESILRTCVQIAIDETMGMEYLCEIAGAISKVASYYLAK